ncbi:dehydrogenase [Subtercola boreus]|uniref:Dehydrogenase n=1 Tax=Subtercola boreus TaxID=120213 RepID=A0A3E0VFA5_9MICO|nr:NAD(P)/FAD-dependent oxidoreductase [Subtercola boreus]RFA08339.1 dehydrogenase [Subtercola boreus]
MSQPDAVVVGAGPNGLAAAVTLARAGLSVEVFERSATIGGGARTEALTETGFLHDVGSAVHPMALASEFFRRFELDKRVDFVIPEASYGHPLDGGGAGIAYRDLARTADGLGVDGRAWHTLFAPLVDNIDEVMEFISGSLIRIPRHLVAPVRFGLRVLEQGTPAARLRFRNLVAPAMMAGLSAHSVGRIPSLSTAGAGLVLGAHAHARGWPIPVGGSASIVAALAADLVAHGGIIHTDAEITSLSELPRARAVLLDVSARAALGLAEGRLTGRYARALRRFSYGNGVFKLDLATSAPIPWTNSELATVPTLHLGGTRSAIASGERDVALGREARKPYVLLSQPSIVDSTRAPAGKHVVWAYTHVPRFSTVDHTETVVGLIERYAPGFRDTIIASASKNTSDLFSFDPNLIGGDISSGAITLRQLIARPTVSPAPWRTPLKGLYLCSSSTPPGTGVHGSAGWNAAKLALRDRFGITRPPDLAL